MSPAVHRQLIEPLLRKAAESYIAGPELADALTTAGRFMRQGIASTICSWDSVTDSPREVADRYQAALSDIERSGLDCYLSIKAPALAFDETLAGGIVSAAARAAVKIHFDSHGPETAERTFRLAEQARAIHPNIGCTLPGRWKRSVGDADWACELGLDVRVVKGQWADATEDAPFADGYLAVIDALAGRARRVAVATHNPVLAERALTRLLQTGTPCELELLFGLPVHAVIKVASRFAVPVRYYVPYGHAWLPYAMAHAAKNPRIFWWVLKDAFLKPLAA